MGQKVNPIGLRVGINRTWDSRWFDDRKYADKLVQDLELRKYVQERLKAAGISKVIVERARERRQQNQPVNPPIEQPADLLEPFVLVLLEVGHLLAVADPHGDRQIVRLRQHHMNARQHVDPERIERRNHHANRARSSSLHPADEQVTPPA